MLYGNLFLEGVEDLHGEEYDYKEDKISNIKKIFKSYGYRQIVTPSFEYYDLYTKIEGSLEKEKMFKLIDERGRILVLRPDATIPVARMAATNYKSDNEYLKLSYITNIFRLDRVSQGRKKEFIQGGIEYFGNSNPDCDAEVIAIGIKALLECGFSDFHIDLGQVEFLNSLLDQIELDTFERQRLNKLIENKNYGELDQFLNELGIDKELANTIRAIPRLYGKPEKILLSARSILKNKGMEKSLNNLEKVYSILKDYGYHKYILFDLGFAKELNYYTGVVFKGYVKNYGEVILSGGRYDNLTKQFGTHKPACGLGINIDKLVEVMKMYDMSGKVECYSDYLVLYREESRSTAIKLSEDLRKRGYVVEMDLCDKDIRPYIEKSNFRNIKEILEVDSHSIKSINLYQNETQKHSITGFYRLLDAKENIFSIH